MTGRACRSAVRARRSCEAWAGKVSAAQIANERLVPATSCDDDTKEAAFRFMNALKLIVRSSSLGDVFTSVLHPATASHRDLIPARRRELGIVDGLVRISVGIEKIDDIIADIEQSLSTDYVD